MNRTASLREAHPYRRLTPRERYLEWGLIFAFWTFMALLMASSRILDPRSGELAAGAAQRELLRAFAIYYFWALLTPGIFWIGLRFSIEQPSWKRYVPLHLGVALLVAIVADLFQDFVRVYLFPTPGRSATFDPLRDIQRLWFLNELILYLAVFAAGIARDYFLRYRARQEEASRLRAQLAEARLETLRMQLNPHFLFNTLHAISTLVERDPRGVRRMIARLSTLLRNTLEGTNAQEVPLHQELAFLRDYLEIQQIRFQGRLEVREVVEPAVVDALVPNLILQPLVENAIKHGVSQTEGEGRIELHAWREGAHLHLSVRDNGPGLAGGLAGDGALEPGFGLSNTQARLEGLYGTAQTLTFQPADGGGLVVTLTLPFHTTSDLRASTVPAPAKGF